MSKASERYETIWSDLPSVTIIVLNYNSEEYLEACFRSLQKLIYPTDRLELILVDNASTDASLQYARENLSQVKIISNDRNYGFCRGNNIGAEKSRHELIAFLNPDMRVQEQWLIELVKPLLDDPDIAAVGSKILSWDGQTVDFGGGAANFYGYGYQKAFGQLVTENIAELKPTLFACGGAMLIRRHLFLEIGGFDEDFFAYYEDLDLGWRLWVLGYKVVLATASIAYHVHHGSWRKVNQEKKRVLYERNAFFTLLKNYHEVHLNKILPVAWMLLVKRIYLAAGIDDRLFRLEPSRENEITHEKPPKKVASTSSTYNWKYYLRTTWQILMNAGLSSLYLKIKMELKRRWSTRRDAQIPGKMRINDSSDEAVVSLQALSYVVAGNDIITLYEKMLKKRQLIQSYRRRSDEEIFELFGRPLDFSERWPEYQQTQLDLSRLFGIDKIFAD